MSKKKDSAEQVFPPHRKGPHLTASTSQKETPITQSSVRFGKISLAGRAPQLQLTFCLPDRPQQEHVSWSAGYYLWGLS